MKKIYLFAITATITLCVAAQSPGGINTGLKLWVKANAPTLLDTSITNFGVDTLVNSWAYSNDGTKVFTASGNARPNLNYNSINFLPALTFAGGQLLQGPNGANAPIAAGDDDYAVFAVWRSSRNDAYQRIWSQRDLAFSNNADGAALSTWNDGRYGDQIERNPFDHTVQRTYNANSWNISQLNLLNQALNDLQILDDRNLSTGGITLNTDPLNTDGAALRNLVTISNHLGARSSQYDEPLYGNIVEVIVYENAISGTDRAKIFSYLALKYGIAIATDFVNAAGATIWNATTNASFNTDVFGIGQDDASGLLTNQSNSINSGSGTGNGQSGRGNIVLSAPSALADGDFLLIGNDNGPLVETLTDLPIIATGSSRLVREWKVQHTNNVGTVSISIDLTGIPTTGVIGTINDFRIMIDEDGDGDFTTGTPTFVAPVGFTGNRVNFAGITLNNNVVFTFITKALGSLPVSWKAFDVKVNGNDVTLNWTVDNNAQAKVYEVQHSTDGRNFSTIGNVSNTASIKTYSFVHVNVTAGTHYYRIRQADADGRVTYTSVKDITIKGDAFTIKLLSNPVKTSYAELEINAASASELITELWTVNGTRINTVQQKILAGKNRIKIAMERVGAGNYILKVKAGNTNQTIQLVKL